MDLTTVEADLVAAAARVEHAVAWLLGMAEIAHQDVQTLEASSPLVKDAIVAGEAAATARGIPVAAIEAGADTVLAMAKQVSAAHTTVPAPGVPAPATPAA